MIHVYTDGAYSSSRDQGGWSYVVLYKNHLIKKEDLPLLPSKIEGTICVIPNKFYEGFFIAKIRRIR